MTADGRHMPRLCSVLFSPGAMLSRPVTRARKAPALTAKAWNRWHFHALPVRGGAFFAPDRRRQSMAPAKHTHSAEHLDRAK